MTILTDTIIGGPPHHDPAEERDLVTVVLALINDPRLSTAPEDRDSSDVLAIKAAIPALRVLVNAYNGRRGQTRAPLRTPDATMKFHYDACPHYPGEQT